MLGLILVPNGKHFGKMLGDQYSHYEPQSVLMLMNVWRKNCVKKNKGAIVIVS